MTIAENSEIRVFELLGVFDFTWTALISVHKKKNGLEKILLYHFITFEAFRKTQSSA